MTISQKTLGFARRKVYRYISQPISQLFSQKPSFPSNQHCQNPFLIKLRRYIIELWPKSFPKQPFATNFLPSTCNIYHLAVPETFAHNTRIRLIATQTFDSSRSVYRVELLTYQSLRADQLLKEQDQDDFLQHYICLQQVNSPLQSILRLLSLFCVSGAKHLQMGI